MKIVIDPSAWVEIFLGSMKGQSVVEVIQDAELVLTPEIVLAEISRKYLRERAKEQVIRSRLRTITESSELSQIDENIALEGAKAYLEIDEKAKKSKNKKPSLFDAIVLAIARINKPKVLTGGLHFKDLPETVWLK